MFLTFLLNFNRHQNLSFYNGPKLKHTQLIHTYKLSFSMILLPIFQAIYLPSRVTGQASAQISASPTRIKILLHAYYSSRMKRLQLYESLLFKNEETSTLRVIHYSSRMRKLQLYGSCHQKARGLIRISTTFHTCYSSRMKKLQLYDSLQLYESLFENEETSTLRVMTFRQ